MVEGFVRLSKKEAGGAQEGAKCRGNGGIERWVVVEVAWPDTLSGWCADAGDAGQLTGRRGVVEAEKAGWAGYNCTGAQG